MEGGGRSGSGTRATSVASTCHVGVDEGDDESAGAGEGTGLSDCADDGFGCDEGAGAGVCPGSASVSGRGSQVRRPRPTLRKFVGISVCSGPGWHRFDHLNKAGARREGYGRAGYCSYLGRAMGS